MRKFGVMTLLLKRKFFFSFVTCIKAWNCKAKIQFKKCSILSWYFIEWWIHFIKLLKFQKWTYQVYWIMISMANLKRTFGTCLRQWCFTNRQLTLKKKVFVNQSLEQKKSSFFFFFTSCYHYKEYFSSFLPWWILVKTFVVSFWLPSILFTSQDTLQLFRLLSSCLLQLSKNMIVEGMRS